MKAVKAHRTARDTGERFADAALPSGTRRNGGSVIKVDSRKTYQKIIGFGGAFTEAAAVTLSEISPELRAEAIGSYFDRDRGLGYSIGRVHIHSCDFALGNYTYVKDGDRDLATFDISHDRDLIIPLIKDALKVRGDGIKLLASPWSPPAWMKSNGEMNRGGKLLPEYRDAWAKYYVKFIEAYGKEGIPVWALTVQNEPAAVQTWDSCIYSGEEERDFIRDHLGPALNRAFGDEVKLLIWDHNRDIMVERAKAVLDDPEAAKYVWGTGFHWYVSEAFENVGKVHDLFPEKHLLFTEGCQEGGCKIGEWYTGERYGRNMIGDFNNWCEGYLDWNLVLDETGGPNHVNNLCDAPIIADTKENRLHFNSSWYYIGHFSRFVRPGALRLFCESTAEKIYSAAFRNEDGTVALIVMNESDEERSAALDLDGESSQLDVPAHSITTLICE